MNKQITVEVSQPVLDAVGDVVEVAIGSIIGVVSTLRIISDSLEAVPGGIGGADGRYADALSMLIEHLNGTADSLANVSNDLYATAHPEEVTC